MTLCHDSSYRLWPALQCRRELIRNFRGGFNEFPITPAVRIDQQCNPIRVESRMLEDSPTGSIARRESLDRSLMRCC